MQIQYISEKQEDKQKWHVIDSLLVVLNDMILCVPPDSYGKIYLPQYAIIHALLKHYFMDSRLNK